MLYRSKTAIEKEHMFYNVDCIIYVEGEDDIVFWDCILRRDAIPKYKVKQVGGKGNLIQYLNYIDNDTRTFTVACDRDYRDFVNPSFSKKVLVTYGHSIENTMYCGHQICDMIFKFGRGVRHDLNFVCQWTESIEASIKELLKYDIANEKYDLGISVGVESSERFLSENPKYLLDQAKIESHIDSIKNSFNRLHIEEISAKIDSMEIKIYKCIRGHFLTALVRNYICTHSQVERSCRKIDISNEALFSLLIGKCGECTHVCKEKDYYQASIVKFNENFAI